MTMGHWRAVCWVHLEDRLKFGLPAWICFAGTSTILQKGEIFSQVLQRSCVYSCSPGLSGSSRNVHAHFPSKKMQCWVSNLQMIYAFLADLILEKFTSKPNWPEWSWCRGKFDETWTVSTPEKILSGSGHLVTFSSLLFLCWYSIFNCITSAAYLETPHIG